MQGEKEKIKGENYLKLSMNWNMQEKRHLTIKSEKHSQIQQILWMYPYLHIRISRQEKYLKIVSLNKKDTIFN